MTLFDVYECAINPRLLEQRIEEARERFEDTDYVLIEPKDYYAKQKELQALPFRMDSTLLRMKAPASEDTERLLTALGVPHESLQKTGPEAKTTLEPVGQLV